MVHRLVIFPLEEGARGHGCGYVGIGFVLISGLGLGKPCGGLMRVRRAAGGVGRCFYALP